jgi:DNA-binding transcriptional MerR regulator
MKTYKTSEIAGLFGIHPNTVRLYEEWRFIKKPARKANGYRVYTDLHVAQMKFARTALKGEILQNGIRKQAIQIIKKTAVCHFEDAICLTKEYIEKIENEKKRAEEAVEIAGAMLCDAGRPALAVQMTRKQTADYLDISIDTLRNWELNGLFTIKKKENGYRIYDGEDIKRLTIIGSLRCANYSLMAILRMLEDFSAAKKTDLKNSIDSPKETEDIISVCDRLLTSLENTAQDARSMLDQLITMKRQFI